LIGKKNVSALAISILLLSLCLFSVPMFKVVKAQDKGPRSDFEFLFYNDFSEAYTALKNGDIDLVTFPINDRSINYTYLQDAESDPNLMVIKGITAVMHELDINNNYTITDYPDVKSPTHEVKFRQAIAHAINKDYIVSEFVSGGVRIDQPCAAPSISWMNETYLGEGYPYKYNLTRAAELLDELGFVDTDDSGWRNYPLDWPGAPGADFTDFPLKVCVRSDHVPRLETGRYLVTQLESLGIKCDKIEGNIPVLKDVVMANRNYHIYTAGWSFPIKPDHLPLLYHSDYWVNETDIFSYNYVTGRNESNMPNYPELDMLLEEMRQTASFEEAKTACKKALGYFTEQCINIPLWTPINYFACRKELHNVFNQDPRILQPLDKYALLNAYKNDSGPIKVGSTSSPDQLNILHSMWNYDYHVLDCIYDELTYFQQQDLLIDKPWVANSWETDSWYDTETGENKTKFTFHLRNDSYWVKPVTGDPMGQFTAEDYEFSVWYQYQTPSSWWYGNFMDVHHIKTVGNFTVEIYMNTNSIWAFNGLTRPSLPMQVWTNFTQLAELKTDTFTEGVNATTPGYLNLTFQDVGAPVAIESVKANTIELSKYVEYDMIGGKLKILGDIPNGTQIEVTYWARGNSEGFFPGDLPWQDILVGNGPFYVTDFASGAGGHVYLKANPNYFVPPTAFNRDVAVLNVTPSKTLVHYGESVDIKVLVENQGNISETFEVELYLNTTLVATRSGCLPANTSQILNFEWDSLGFDLGNYTIKAVAETLPDETDTFDNTLVDGTLILTPGSAHVYIMPSSTKITLGVPFSIDVMISNVADLYGFEIKLGYNTTILNAINASEGSFLKQAGETWNITEINDAGGYVKFAVSRLSVENGVNGSGTLFTLTFNSSLSATGTTSIAFNTVKLSNPQSQPISHTFLGGSVEVVEIDTKSFSVVENETTFNIPTVSNSTILELNYNESDGKISLISTGPSGYSSFCNITIPKELLNGTFAVLVNNQTAYYEKIENATHYTLCFNFTHSTVEIEIFLTLKGDLNGDRKVNIYDIVMIASAYGSKPEDPNWNPIADLVKDGEIDIFDAVIVCRQFGSKWP